MTRLAAKKDANHNDIVRTLEAVGLHVTDLSKLGFGFFLWYNLIKYNSIKNDRGGAGNTPRSDTMKGNFMMQPHSNRAPYFPENLDDYAPWVTQCGLFAPYGQCQCGCGQATTLAAQSETRTGLKKGHPRRFFQRHRISTPQYIKTCAQCGKDFDARSASAFDKVRCCSKQCSLEYRAIHSTAIQLVCRGCGEEFKAYENQNYCTRKCKDKHASVSQKTCPTCKSTFAVKPSHWNKVVYCSKNCMAEGYRLQMTGKDNPNFRNAGWCICLGCGKSFHSYDKNRKYCSSTCYVRKNMRTRMNTLTKHNSTYKGGKRDDLGGLYVRSAWEANYARYLNWLVSVGEIVRWEFEPDEFEFTGIKRGTKFYIPDFKIFNRDGTVEYHEVKGYMNSESATKLKRMEKYYPDVVVKLIDKKAYTTLAKQMRSLIPEWE